MLAPCTKCKRFARPHEACPFCGGHVQNAKAITSLTRLSRTAVIALVASCGGPTQPAVTVGPSVPSDAGSVVEEGAPILDGGLATPEPVPVPTAVPAYGIAPTPPPAPTTTGVPTAMPLYGAPPMVRKK